VAQLHTPLRDAATSVAELKSQPGKDIGMDIGVLGSGELAQSLMRHNLVHTHLLPIHPLGLGSR
jgi:dihydrofolate reductase